MNPRLSRFREIVIDTGPPLLYLVGSYDKRYLSRFSYDEYEFLLLIRYLYLSSFKNVYVTPQVLAEASNLAKRRLKKEYYSIFIRRSIVLLVGLWEEYVAKDEIFQFFRYGHTVLGWLGCLGRETPPF